MNWTLEQLRAFAAAAEMGSFSAAGRAMGKAQSVISTHIAMLEDCLGIELFSRSSRSPILTEAGRALLKEAHAVLRQSHKFDACAIAQYKGDAVSLSIAVSHGIPFQGISESMVTITKKYPFLTGSFQILSSDRVWNQVNENTAQIGIVWGALPELKHSCGIECLGQIRYCLVASKDCPLSGMRHIKMDDLAQYRQIVFDRASSERYMLNSQYWEVNDVFIAMYWASLGIGWAAVPLGLITPVRESGAMKDLVILDMEDMAMIAHNVYLIWNNGFSRRDILDDFSRDLKKCYQEAIT
ncbi:MAG: LysR family transcriptional regulator [Mailhella sp.]